MADWQPIETAPKEPINEFGFGPALLLRVGDFVISDQWKPGLPEYPLQSHWRNWPYVQPRQQPSHWAALDALPNETAGPAFGEPRGAPGETPGPVGANHGRAGDA